MKKIKKFHRHIIILSCCLILSAPSLTVAQPHPNDSIPRPRTTFADRLFIGGTFGVQFGDVTLVDVSPLVGFHITPRLSAAVGVIYQYYDDNYYHYSTHIYGGRTWARCYVYKNALFAHAEYELVNYQPYSFLGNERISVGSFLLGGGYTQWIGPRAFMSLTVLWNFTESPYSLYDNPIFQIGFGTGL
ncbi:MAG TPA: hypothetical protein PK711_12635 [Bacteroidales bacterium]|nr:hypothetical protein [Bacteroidales bacterium]